MSIDMSQSGVALQENFTKSYETNILLDTVAFLVLPCLLIASFVKGK
jgi:hypothetical protein